MMLVFSDLDGSLLDHDTYDYQAAGPALEAIRRHEIPLVLVSSKTLAELQDYRQQLRLAHPVVAENGAALSIPEDYFPGQASWQSATKTRAEIQATYKEVTSANDYRCEAFFELGVAGIMRETGLPEDKAALANDRVGSEPILWKDSDDKAESFEQEMASRGLRCTRGGRFLHLMDKTSKEEAVDKLIQAYEQKWPDENIVTVALGDGPNDLGMLATTDIAVVIPGKHKHSMELESNNRVLRPTPAGPVGWNEAMLTLIAEHYNNPAIVNGD